MHPHTNCLHLRLRPSQGELIYWELLGLLNHYRSNNTALDPGDEAGLLDALRQLELGLARCQAIADAQLEQLRGAIHRGQTAAATRQEG